MREIFVYSHFTGLYPKLRQTDLNSLKYLFTRNIVKNKIEMAFAISNVDSNEVCLPMEENNESKEYKLRLKQEPIDLDSEQKPPVIHSTAGDIRIACVYSGLETRIVLKNTNVQINDISMDDETLCILEQRNPEDGCIEINSEGKNRVTIVKTEVDETNCNDIKSERLFPNSYKDDAQGVQERVELIKDETDVINIPAKNEILEMKPEPSLKTESDEEDMKFENEEEFLSEDEFLSDNECGEDNENVASPNTNALSSTEDEDTTTANQNENLKKLVHFDNPILGDIIDIYKNYDELWDTNKLENLPIEKLKRLMQNMCAGIRMKLNVTLTSLDLEIILTTIHKTFSSEKKRRLKCELEQQEFTSLLPNFYRCNFLEDHQGPFRCLNCNVIIKQFQQFQEHKSQHDTNVCDICGQVWKNKKSLKFHKRYKHDVVLYICELCDISFVDEKSFKYHKHIKHINKCEVCGKIYPNRKSLRQHYIHIHVVHDEKSLQCKVCGKTSHNLKAFINHKIFHSTVRHVCPICEKGFKHKNNLNRHIKNIHGSKKFPCKFCGVKVYSCKKSLRKHLKVCK